MGAVLPSTWYTIPGIVDCCTAAADEELRTSGEYTGVVWYDTTTILLYLLQFILTYNIYTSKVRLQTLLEVLQREIPILVTGLQTPEANTRGLDDSSRT